VALAYARAPEAVTIRAEISRTLLDLADRGRASRLTGVRDLLARAGDLVRSLDGAAGRPRKATGKDAEAAPDDGPDADAGAVRAPAAERRRAALVLVAIWRDLVRDLALVERGELRPVRETELLDELESAAGRLGTGSGFFLARLARAGELLEGNVGPELALDVLALAWGRAA
jgi:hypothetical protein